MKRSMRSLIAAASLLALLFVFAGAAQAQNFIQITGTVTDPNGIPYSNATLTGLLTPGAPGGWTLGGQPYSGRLQNTNLDVNGHFVAQVGNNSAILPAGSQWLLTVSIAPGILPPLGTGPQSFSITITLNSSQDISAQLDAAAPKLTNFAGSGPGGCPGTATPNQIFYDNAGTCAGILGSNVTAATGAVTLTATGPTVIPFSIANATSQTSSLMRVTNALTGGGQQGLVSIGGFGVGNYGITDEQGPALLDLNANCGASCNLWAIIFRNQMAPANSFGNAFFDDDGGFYVGSTGGTPNTTEETIAFLASGVVQLSSAANKYALSQASGNNNTTSPVHIVNNGCNLGTVTLYGQLSICGPGGPAQPDLGLPVLVEMHLTGSTSAGWLIDNAALANSYFAGEMVNNAGTMNAVFDYWDGTHEDQLTDVPGTGYSWNNGAWTLSSAGQEHPTTFRLGTPATVATQFQGTDTHLLTAGTIAGTGATLCTDANAGATTSGCTSFTSAITCGATAACGNTSLGSVRIATGQGTTSGGATSNVTITGITPAFTSNATYRCTTAANSTSGSLAAEGEVNYVSGSSFTITTLSSVAQAFDYICIGN